MKILAIIIVVKTNRIVGILTVAKNVVKTMIVAPVLRLSTVIPLDLCTICNNSSDDTAVKPEKKPQGDRHLGLDRVFGRYRIE